MTPQLTPSAYEPRDLEASLSDAELASALVREAGTLAWRMRQGGLSGERKTNVADVVTAADRAAEAYVLAQLRRCRPLDGVLGEEGSSKPSESGRTWVIDPVDGTYNFLRGSSYWCSALALATDYDGVLAPLLGAVFQPEEDKLWLGGTDVPLTLNGAALPSLKDRPLNESSAATYIHPDWLQDPMCAMPWHAAAVGAASLRMLGSGSCDLSRVAQGELDVWFQHSCPDWDWLPGAALVRAAGGVATTLRINGLSWFLAGPAGAVGELKRAMDSARVS
ncbi:MULTISPECIES: inositol monophosphatase family protein [Arthrobacter]|uniref:Inositol monophosphatase family protein n=2 Tax=Arthrobacter TaxID=1663 RepID=A0ABU9KQG2_9MICC|nr:inositol monophosphatase family protein [Arthrobacter sp. YJM1]MDP5227743.1 inositol monophosphatase family protein [Arthrobacter sp. YJM1]